MGHGSPVQLVESLTQFLNGLDEQPDLVVALLASDFLDKALFHLLAARLTDQRLGEEQLGPLSLQRKVQLAQLVGLVGPNMASDLRIICKVRNKLAHSLDVIDFAPSEVTTLCDALVLPDLVDPQTKGKPRARFLVSARLLVGHLGSRLSGVERLPPGPDFKVITTDTPASGIVEE